MAITSPSDAALSTEDDLLRILLGLDECWWSDLQLSWELGGDDLNARRAVRGLLSAIGRTGALERIFVKHRGGEPFACTRIDRDAILEALGEDQ